jgi:hypothetical protein
MTSPATYHRRGNGLATPVSEQSRLKPPGPKHPAFAVRASRPPSKCYGPRVVSAPVAVRPITPSYSRAQPSKPAATGGSFYRGSRVSQPPASPVRSPEWIDEHYARACQCTDHVCERLIWTVNGKPWCDRHKTLLAMRGNNAGGQNVTRCGECLEGTEGEM